jgi:hypothetical protein
MAEHCLELPLAAKSATNGKLPTIDGFAARAAWNRGLLAEVFSEQQAALDWLNAFSSKPRASSISHLERDAKQ